MPGFPAWMKALLARGFGTHWFGQSATDLRRQRRALAELDDRLLEDIGLSRHAAAKEAQRPVWDVPRHWRVAEPSRHDDAPPSWAVSDCGPR